MTEVPTKLILVVDDNMMNLELLVTILNANGYKTLSTGSGLEALELAKENRPDLILMDIQMPEVDGYMALDMLRKEQTTHDIPVIAVTGNGMARDLERVANCGFDQYVVKPYKIKAILATIQEFLI